jgi:hypothetical protein
MKDTTCTWKDPETGQVCGGNDDVRIDWLSDGEIEINEGPGWYEEVHPVVFAFLCPVHREAKRRLEKAEYDDDGPPFEAG